MKHLLTCALTLLLSLCLFAGACAWAEEEPVAAPDFSFSDELGEHYFTDYLGKPILMNIWAPWCPPCRAELPHFDEAYATYGDRINFLMISVDGDQDYAATVASFLLENGYSFPSMLDPNANSLMTYGINSIPVTVIVAPDGTLLGGQVGMLDAQTLQAYIDVLLSYVEE